MSKPKNADEYILRCIKEGKIIVDHKNGEIFSTYLNKNYKQMINWAGYHYLDFKFFGERWSILVHRAVYLAKHGKIPEGYVIDHIDRNTSNNKLSNLRAVTHKVNMNNISFKKKSKNQGYWKQPDKEHCIKCERTMPMTIKDGRMGGLIVVCEICGTLSSTQKATWSNGIKISDISDGLILVDSDDAKLIGFTKKLFTKQSYIFKRNNELCFTVICIHPEKQRQGNLTNFIKNVETMGFIVKIPEPMNPMKNFLKKNNWKKTIEDCELPSGMIEETDVWVR